MEALTLHKSHGTAVHIHVLAVRQASWKQGKGPVLLWRYLQQLHRLSRVRRAVLMCPDFPVPFYHRSSFKVKGPRNVNKGPLTFVEIECPVGGQPFMRWNSEH